jgi:hypothetical protein
MPRGIYDRSKAKKRTKTAAPTEGAPVKRKPGRPPKNLAAVTAAAPKAKAKGKIGRPRKTVETVVSRQQVDARDQFAIVRENLIALSQVRAHVKENESTETVDAEMAKQLGIMTALRQQHFGHLSPELAEVQSPEETPAEVQAVPQAASVPLPPLPPPPSLPLPQQVRQ